MSTRLFEDDVIFLQRLLKCEGLYKKAIDGDWGPGTDKAYDAFNAASAELATTFGAFDARSERNIQTLTLRAQKAARTMLRSVIDGGIDARIISGTRTYGEQNRLFRQGRFGNPGPVVTNARGGQSNHNFGIAWDIGVFKNGQYLGDSPLYRKAAEFALAADGNGLEWGGNWTTFKDQPHYQIATKFKLSAIRDLFEHGQPYLM